MKFAILFILLANMAMALVPLESYTDGTRIYHRAPLTARAIMNLFEDYALYFEETDELGWCNKDNQPALGAYANALYRANSTNAIDAFVADCAAKTDFTIDDFYAAYENATNYLVNATEDPNFNITEIYNRPVIIPDETIQAGIDSYVSRYQNYNYGYIYGAVLASYWFLLIFASGVWTFIKYIAPSSVKKFSGKFSNKFRSWITVPATFNKHHNDYFYFMKSIPFLIPTRWESIMIGVWLFLFLVFNSTDYEHIENNTIWSITYAEMGRKVCDRTGVQILFLMPSLMLFAGRNNFLQYVTGWKYSRFVLIHKWLARIVTLLTMLHTIGVTFNGKGVGNYETRNSRAYVQWGYVAFIAMIIMCVQAMSFLRKNNYETFLLMHIILAVFAIVGGWIHCEENVFEDYYTCAAVVWAFDRFVRLVRMMTFGVRSALVELKVDETLKVTVERPTWWKASPGAHAFVSFFRPTMFWQSHPFTVMSVDEKTITFCMKIKGGFTHGLMQYLVNQPGQKAQVKISVEGPYGGHLSLSRYDRNVMISSGHGIPGLYAEALDLAAKQENSSIKFIWIIRQFKSIEWFYEELMKLNHPNISLDVYVTRGELEVNPFWSEGSISEENSDKNEKHPEKTTNVEDLKQKLSHVTFYENRPNINQIVAEEIQQATGSVAFSSCCHASIDDDVRKAVAINLPTATTRIELFDQNQMW